MLPYPEAPAGNPAPAPVPAELSPVPDAPAGGERSLLLRFDTIERAAHWLMALMFITLVVTGAILYLPSLVELIGRRRLVERVHVDVGLAIPLPLLVSLAGKWGQGLRADIRRLNRWDRSDREWLRRVVYDRRVGDLKVGKFNAGQKLNAAFTLGAFLVMLMTGAVMHWEYHFRLSWRTGATFIHESLAYVFLAVALGHIFMALTHPGALRSIFTGKVTRKWAGRHSALWLEEIDRPGDVRPKT